MKLNDYTDANEWVPAGGIKLENRALNAVKTIENTMVIAGPGAGKTELLAQRACYLLQTNTCANPQNILAISLKKDAASNLSERVERRCGKELAQRFQSMTYDAFAKELVDRFNKAIPNLYRPDRNYDIAEIGQIRKAFELAGFHPDTSKKNRDINILLNKALIQKRLPVVLNDKAMNKILRESWRILLKGDSYNNFKPLISFQMISRLAEYLIRENPLIQTALQMTYSHVFLDEFQDTTDIQYELVKTCFLNSKVIITAVGDNKQRIMVWARAMDNIFCEYEKDFNANELKLIMNHRSAPRLVELQKLLYVALNEEELEIETSPKWKPEDGDAYLRIFNDHVQEADVIAEEIEDLISKNIKLQDICILVKQLPNIYGEEIIKRLNSKGIRARNESLYQDFLKEACVKIYINMFYLMYTDRNADAWIYIMDSLSLIRGFDSEIEVDKAYELQNELDKFLTELKTQLSTVNDKDELQTVIWSIVNYFGLELIKGAFSQYKRGSFLELVTDNMVEFLWEEYEETNDWLKAIENLEGLNSIPVMTIHKSKGLEYDTIFFVGLEDAAFWNFKEQPDEDRCVFFVALSRAKRRVDFTFSKKRPTQFKDKQSIIGIKEFYDLLRDSSVVEELAYTTE